MFDSRYVGALAPLLLLVLCAQSAFAAPSDWEAEIRAYEQRDATSPPAAGQVVVTGSSSIVMWNNMASDLAPVTVIPRGFGGSIAADLDYFLDRIVLKYSPRAVVIYEGDNDIGAGLSPESIASVMGNILGRISARLPNARVYVISVKLSPVRMGQAAQLRQLNQLYAALCAGDARYTYIDIMSRLLGSDGAPIAAYYQSDGLHLNPAGYQVWASAIRSTVVPQQQIPAPADATAPSMPGGLTATAVNSGRVDLRWAASGDSGVGLAGYRIWRDGQALTTTTATAFSDTGLLANTGYTYNVSAYDRVQPLANESARAGPAFATTASQGALPAVRLSAASTTVIRGNATLLNWSVTDATSCTAGGAWSGARGTVGSQQTAALTASAVYTLSCVGPGGSASGSVTVAVVPPPSVSVNLSAAPLAVVRGGKAQLTWSSLNATDCNASGGWTGAVATSGSWETPLVGTRTQYVLTCTGPGGSSAATASVDVTYPAPTVSLTANPATVVSGASTTLRWTATDADSCAAVRAWNGSRPTAGSETTPTLMVDATFALTCTGPAGVAVTTEVVVPVTAAAGSTTPEPVGTGSGGSTGSAASAGAGGGGATDWFDLCLLAILLAGGRIRYTSPSPNLRYSRWLTGMNPGLSSAICTHFADLQSSPSLRCTPGVTRYPTLAVPGTAGTSPFSMQPTKRCFTTAPSISR